MSKATRDIAVVVPTYNERDNLEPLAREVLASPLRPRLIVVDDHSPDGTGRLAEELARRNSHLRVIHRPLKLGLGTAYIAGFRRALDEGAQRIVTMDADFSHHPRYLTALVESSDRWGLVIGSRYVPGGGALNCGLGRRVLSRSANLFARTMLGLRVQDCTAGFRCYRREVLESIDLDHIFSDGYSFLIEMLYNCQQLDWPIGEIPILFEDRRQGKSKISRAEIGKALMTVLRLSLHRFRG
ncbi:MAG: polyprenol monophosphomannose synthase [Chloroflexi bacterium]|nr:polyprenol monophosphomannose synthase [Chloroflexota bacterium]